MKDLLLDITRVLIGCGMLVLAMALLINTTRKLINRALHLLPDEPIGCLGLSAGFPAWACGSLIAPETPVVGVILFLLFLLGFWPAVVWLPQFLLRRLLASDSLAAAVFDRKLEKVKRALESGCNPNRQGYQGWTSLHINALNYNEEIARTLLAAGASQDIPNDDGHTPNHILVYFFSGLYPSYELSRKYKIRSENGTAVGVDYDG